MKVVTLGEKKNPAVVMIPGMFCSSDMPAVVGQRLKDDYFVILPNLDGHYKEQPVYHDVKTDGRELKEWLEAHHIDHLALLQGTSMGAEVALEAAHQLVIPVDHYLFDGGPFFHFPGFFRAIMAKKFLGFGKVVKGKSEEQAVDDLLKNRFVKKLGGSSLESYRGVMGGFCRICQWIDDDSVRRIADTCYKCDLPDFDEETVRKFIFLFSENEPARKSENRLRKKYPDALYVIAQGYGHGGYQTADPKGYAELMREIAEGKTIPEVIG